jgi:putative transposase
MARPLRIEYPGAVYHLTSRGNARAPIFLDDADRYLFLNLLGDLVDRYKWLCHGYCLMDNHYHLLVETIEANLSTGMRQLNGIYTQKFNRPHDRVGHLFQGIYKAIVVEKESYLFELYRYIVLNPVRAKIVNHHVEYRWSSYKANAEAGPKLPFLYIDWVLGQFGNSKDKARQRYKEFVLSDQAGQTPWDKLEVQCILGGEKLLNRMSPFLSQKTGEKEITRCERFANRPSLTNLLSSSQAKTDRNRKIAIAHLDYGYSQQDIAQKCGLHYSTVSRIIHRQRKKSNSKT